MTEASVLRSVELRLIEANLVDAYEAASLAAETLEVPAWAESGAKIAAALADVRAALAVSDVGSRPSRPRPSAGPER